MASAKANSKLSVSNDAMNVPERALHRMLRILKIVRRMCGKFRVALRENSLLQIETSGESVVLATLVEIVQRAQALQSVLGN
jgi:hypothetical protein